MNNTSRLDRSAPAEVYEYYGAAGYSNRSESKGMDEDKKQITVRLLGELTEIPDKVQDTKTLLMDIRRHRDRRDSARIKKKIDGDQISQRIDPSQQ